MRTCLFLCLLLSITSFAVGQTKINFEIIKGYYKGEEPIWYSCNEDSSFFKSDTVIFSPSMSGNIVDWWYCTHIDSLHRSNCCNYFEMKIIDKNINQIFFGNVCSEPPTIVIDYDLKRKKINSTTGKINIKNDIYYIFFYRNRKLWMKFQIIELNRKSYYDNKFYPESYDYMKLLRIK